MAKKLKEFQRMLQSEGVDAFLVTNLTNIYYFTEFLSRSYAFLIVFPENTSKILVPELEYEEAKEKIRGYEVNKIERNIELLEMIKQILETNNIKKLGFEESSMTVKLFLDISMKLDFLKLEEGAKLIDNLRLMKTAAEIEKIKRACRIADKGMECAIENIEEGKLEIEIAAEIEYKMRKEGSESTPFDTIVASGYRSAFPHGVSSNKEIEKGEFIILDLGAKYRGYCSDMTRTVVLGPVSKKQADIYDIVLKVEQKSINLCEIGRNTSAIEEKSREIFRENRLNEYFVHSLGHGVGLDVHEGPYLALKSKDILLKDSVFTIEPGIYIPNFGGIRIEDMICLSQNGPEILTKSKYDINI
ncbi:MAG TPA: Xaa-Pro peptidase family protein [Candidatus Deferrimicrobium sp.]|nr:Xaa-Pro peptidase family protein [Candidatus Deferrimicrobium sp.]